MSDIIPASAVVKGLLLLMVDEAKWDTPPHCSLMFMSMVVECPFHTKDLTQDFDSFSKKFLPQLVEGSEAFPWKQRQYLHLPTSIDVDSIQLTVPRGSGVDYYMAYESYDNVSLRLLRGYDITERMYILGLDALVRPRMMLK